MPGKQGWRLGAVEKGNPIHHFLNIFDASLFTRLASSLFVGSGIFPQKTAKQIHALQDGPPRSLADSLYHQFSEIDKVLPYLGSPEENEENVLFNL